MRVALPDSTSVALDDRVYIIQHPHGEVKKLAARHNVVRHVDDVVIQYWTDTARGSSGSPVFDEHWRLVAVHRRWRRIGQLGGADEFRNEGVRIERVREDLVRRQLPNFARSHVRHDRFEPWRGRQRWKPIGETLCVQSGTG